MLLPLCDRRLSASSVGGEGEDPPLPSPRQSSDATFIFFRRRLPAVFCLSIFFSALSLRSFSAVSCSRAADRSNGESCITSQYVSARAEWRTLRSPMIGAAG